MLVWFDGWITWLLYRVQERGSDEEIEWAKQGGKTRQMESDADLYFISEELTWLQCWDEADSVHSPVATRCHTLPRRQWLGW